MDIQVTEEISNDARVGSQSWTHQEWEAHLKSLEVPLKESLIHEKKYDRMAESLEGSVFSYAQGISSPALIERMRAAINILTTRQRQVIEMTYFDLKSSRAIAEELGIYRNAVTKLKAKGLENLRASLAEGVCTFPIVRGQEKPEGSKDE